MNKRSYIIVGAILILLAAGAFVYYKKHPISPKSPYLAKVERNLTQDEKGIYENKLKQGEDQLASLKAAHLTTPDQYFNVYKYIGSQYYGLGELAKAKDAYNTALGYLKENYNGWVALYTVTLEQGDFDGAKQAILKAIEFKSADTDLWRKYIDLTKEHFNAVPSELDGLYKQALDKTGNNADMLALYAQFLESQGKISEALVQWQAALAKAPDNKDYQSEITRLKQIKQ